MAAGSTRRKDTPVGADLPTSEPEGPQRPAPKAPSFGMCEGVRTDLEQVDKTTDPFTGEVVTRSDVK